VRGVGIGAWHGWSWVGLLGIPYLVLSDTCSFLFFVLFEGILFSIERNGKFLYFLFFVFDMEDISDDHSVSVITQSTIAFSNDLIYI
jgi:hypothetical protein